MSSIAIVVKGYPRLSETFIAQEILGLQTRGLDVGIHSLRRPTDKAVHDLHREITAPVDYLPEYLKNDPKRVAAGRRWAEAQPTYAAARAVFERDFARDRTVNRRRRWGQACVLARELPADTGLIYVHFLHTPASVAGYAALLRGLPWAFSAHAKDIWTSPDWELAEKMQRAAWGVTCTRANAEHLNGLVKGPPKTSLLYHGLDLSRFPAPPKRSPRDGSGEPVRILSVGRPVEKKGYRDLLAALAALPKDLDWRFRHIGGSPSPTGLDRLAETLGIAERIEWLGQQPRDAVIAACLDADVFALASRISKTGDRDGLPNVLMEAQAVGLACLSTRVSAIPELIEDDVTGLLVEAGDRRAMAAGLERLIREPATRERLGMAGSERVRTHFDSGPGLDRLAEKLRATLRRSAA